MEERSAFTIIPRNLPPLDPRAMQTELALASDNNPNFINSKTMSAAEETKKEEKPSKNEAQENQPGLRMDVEEAQTLTDSNKEQTLTVSKEEFNPVFGSGPCSEDGKGDDEKAVEMTKLTQELESSSKSIVVKRNVSVPHDSRAEEDEKRNETLLTAILNSDVEFIIEYKHTWNFCGRIPTRVAPVTPLSMLCRPKISGCLKGVGEEGQLKLIEHALGMGADPLYMTKRNEMKALTDTVYQGNVNVLKLFVRKGGITMKQIQDFTYYSVTLLHMACHDSRLEMARYLIEECDMKPDSKDKAGQTPLFWCFARGPYDKNLAEFLLSAGADPFNVCKLPSKNDEPVYMSPMVLGILYEPEFARKVLDSLFRVIYEKGLDRNVACHFGMFVEQDPLNRGYREPRFTTPILPPQDRQGSWETFYYDRDPVNQRSYIELMQDFQVELLSTDIVRQLLRTSHSSIMRASLRHAALIVIYGIFILASMLAWPARQSLDIQDPPVPATSIAMMSCSVVVGAILLRHEFSQFRNMKSKYMHS